MKKIVYGIVLREAEQNSIETEKVDSFFESLDWALSIMNDDNLTQAIYNDVEIALRVFHEYIKE